MTLLARLIDLAPTVERESLVGSGYKRLALLETAAAAAAAKADDQTARAAAEAAEAAAIGGMLTHYEAAETIARKSPSTSTQPFFYPAMNRIAAQLASNAGKQAMDNDTITLVRSSMGTVPPTFWSVVGQNELDMYVAIAANSLAEKAVPLIAKFREHHARIDNTRLWGSRVVENVFFRKNLLQKRKVRSGFLPLLEVPQL